MSRLATLLILGLVAGTAYAADERISFPADYKTSFTNYLSLDRVQNEDQIIRLFANPVALEAAAAGKELPNGSVLVGEIYAAKKDKDGKVMKSALGQRIRDKLAAIAVMQKEEGWGSTIPENLRNGDWDFAIFSPDGKRLNKDLNTCRQCHAPLASTQHLFSLEHLSK
ncbi:MAG: cytochrome P460 family protein [Hyphomicrobium zavarzinii]|uniref:cytochrome P460 family protein n=1 Tax=Hyphomicrobium zavarzinii TaxID=48292 RepID=UPI001A63252E|nr:cytochrome P460 family protein [Hyphomicrobium zavarzinii]MBL8846750.1 cytochrome P460 family protein [Hyphomicrobium zavarzinii]